MTTSNTKKRLINQWVRRNLKLAIIPHSSNQYRPHLIRRYGLGAVLAAIVIFQIGYNFMATGSVLGKKTTITTNALLSDTNHERILRNLKPLRANEQLTTAAQLKAQDMFDKQYWNHESPDGVTPWQWFRRAGYSYAYAGENLARNFTSPEAAVTAWMSSPDHRANILNEHFTEVGFAVMSGEMKEKRATIIVALYGAPAGLAAGVLSESSGQIERPIGLLARVGIAVRTMTPAMIGSMVLLIFVAFVALLAQLYRSRLPKGLRQTWYRHHGLVKAGGVLGICIIILMLYSGGQI